MPANYRTVSAAAFGDAALVVGRLPQGEGAERLTHAHLLDPPSGEWSEIAAPPSALHPPSIESWSQHPLPPFEHGSASLLFEYQGRIELMDWSDGTPRRATFDPAEDEWSEAQPRDFAIPPLVDAVYSPGGGLFLPKVGVEGDSPYQAELRSVDGRFQLTSATPFDFGGLAYQGHSQDYGWLPWVTSGETAGTTGEEKRLEAIRLFSAPPSMHGEIPDSIVCSILRAPYRAKNTVPATSRR